METLLWFECCTCCSHPEDVRHTAPCSTHMRREWAAYRRHMNGWA